MMLDERTRGSLTKFSAGFSVRLREKAGRDFLNDPRTESSMVITFFLHACHLGQTGKLFGLKHVQPLSENFLNPGFHLLLSISGGAPHNPPPNGPERDVNLRDIAEGLP